MEAISSSSSGTDGTNSWTFLNGDIGGEEKHMLTIDEMPSHNHDLTHSQTAMGWGSGSRDDSRGRSDSNSPKNSWNGDVFKIENTGGSSSHNNIPPYIAITIWKRIS